MRYFIYFILSALFIYFTKLPVNPYFISSWMVIFVLIGFWSFIDSFIKENEIGIIYTVFSGIGIVVLLLLVFFNSEIFRAKDYTRILQIKEINSTKVIVSKPEKIRKVTFKMALNKANKILGKNINGVLINTQYEISDNDKAIIMYKGNEYWLLPLQYSSFFKWIGNNNIPGYILVDAINPNADPIFVNKAFKYSPSAYFETNVNRKMWENSNLGLFDYHPEIDEKGDLYYIGVTYKYKILGNVFIPDKIIILNASNGNSKKIKYEEFIKTKKYTWIDKILPEYIIKDYIEWYGKYQEGFWNTVFEQKNITVPTEYNESEIWLVENKLDKYLKWFTGMTSINSKDNSLAYGVMIDSRTLTMYKINDLNNITDEQGAIHAIESKLGANAIQWKPVLPLPIIINKHFYWTTSIISKNTDIYQKTAIVKGNNISEVIIGNTLKEIINNILTNNLTNIKNKKLSVKQQLQIKMKKLKKDLKIINQNINEIEKIIEKLN